MCGQDPRGPIERTFVGERDVLDDDVVRSGGKSTHSDAGRFGNPEVLVGVTEKHEPAVAVLAGQRGEVGPVWKATTTAEHAGAVRARS